MEEKINPQDKPVMVLAQISELIRKARRRVGLKKAKENLEEVLERLKNKG